MRRSWGDSGSRSRRSADRSLRVTSVPALLDWNRSEEALRAVAVDLDGLSPGASVDEALRRVAATMACHAAVKANDPLTREKMQYLLDELRRTSHSSVCPHGRPVVLRLTRREIERNFERILTHSQSENGSRQSGKSTIGESGNRLAAAD